MIENLRSGNKKRVHKSYKRNTGRARMCKMFRLICIRFCYFPPTILLPFLPTILALHLHPPTHLQDSLFSYSSSPCPLFHPSNYPFTNSYLLPSRLLSLHQHSNLLPIYMMLFVHLLLFNHHCSDRHNNNV